MYDMGKCMFGVFKRVAMSRRVTEKSKDTKIGTKLFLVSKKEGYTNKLTKLLLVSKREREGEEKICRYPFSTTTNIQCPQ